LSTSASWLLSGATAPLTKAAGACVEIVFVRIRLCDRLTYALPGMFTCDLGVDGVPWG
jgi:hypothetical protein